MKFKSGVDVSGMHDMMRYAFNALTAIHVEFGYESTITSGRDSKHGFKSKHYAGCAIDVRIRDLPTQLPHTKFAADIKTRLPFGFDVVTEQTHIHIEYDPKFQ